jgi:hypothetical protein
VLSRNGMPEKVLAESLDTEGVHNAFGQCKQLYHMATTRFRI